MKLLNLVKFIFLETKVKYILQIKLEQHCLDNKLRH